MAVVVKTLENPGHHPNRWQMDAPPPAPKGDSNRRRGTGGGGRDGLARVGRQCRERSWGGNDARQENIRLLLRRKKTLKAKSSHFCRCPPPKKKTKTQGSSTTTPSSTPRMTSRPQALTPVLTAEKAGKCAWGPIGSSRNPFIRAPHTLRYAAAAGAPPSCCDCSDRLGARASGWHPAKLSRGAVERKTKEQNKAPTDKASQRKLRREKTRNSGTGTNTEIGTTNKQTNNQTNKQASQQTSKPASQPASQPTNQPTNQAASQASRPAS